MFAEFYDMGDEFIAFHALMNPMVRAVACNRRTLQPARLLKRGLSTSAACVVHPNSSLSSGKEMSLLWQKPGNDLTGSA